MQISLTRRVACRARRQDVWPRLADTERLNRFIGNSPLTVAPADGQARFVLGTRLGPAKVEYEELPYEWSENEFFSFRRVMRSGPVAELAVRYELADGASEGAEVSMTMEVTPTSAFTWPIVSIFSRRFADRIDSYIRAVDEAALHGRTVAGGRRRVSQSGLDRASHELARRHPAALVDRLLGHIADADDLELRRIRPFALADAWGTEVARLDVLKLCLDAVKVGLLELHWDVLCPSCRVAAASFATLAELGDHDHCHVCELDYGIEADRAVEATFTPHPMVRHVRRDWFCIGGPIVTPHVVGQRLLPAGATGSLGAPTAPGHYRLFVRGGAETALDVLGDGPAEVDVNVGAALASPTHTRIATGGRVQVHNDGPPRHAKIERVGDLRADATALHVAMLPAFRAQFGGDSLRPGLALKVSHVAILFSDLVGSTALYSRIGDAAAFGVVTDCLHFGREVVERHGGTVVKTMGDAVMAAFIDERAAVAAAGDALASWPGFQRGHTHADTLDLKIGAYAGPCTVVTANGVLDYFGQTVNAAARVQHLARARELVLPTSLERAAAACTTLGVIERFETRVKGIDAPLSLLRLGPPTRN